MFLLVFFSIILELYTTVRRISVEINKMKIKNGLDGQACCRG